MEKDFLWFDRRIRSPSPTLQLCSECHRHSVRIKESECRSEHVEKHLDDALHRIRRHPPLLQDICQELADEDRPIRKDEPYQLSRTVDHRSHSILQLGIPPLGCVRPYSQLRPRYGMHRSTVHILHLVDEASQERTFRAALVHTHLVRQERLA